MPRLHGSPLLRFAIRLTLAVFRSRIRGVHGTEILTKVAGPVLFVANHSQRPEAAILPAVLGLMSLGRNVHFLTDWNFLVIPGLGWFLSLNEPVVVVRKDLRPKFLNFIKPWFMAGQPAVEQARLRLRLHEPVGIFAEGTVNRRRDTLMRGLTGAAKLSLETGATVVPVGLRFAQRADGMPISDFEGFEIHIGEPLSPPDVPVPSRADIAAWHARIFRSLARLSGKNWSPDNPRTRNETESAS
jgi:1-acyl-sn-glycerol-3-phosphate acyltransferase